MLIVVVLLTLLATAAPPRTDLVVVGHSYYDYFTQSYQEVKRIRVYATGLEDRERTEFNWWGEKRLQVRLRDVKPRKEYQVVVEWENGRSRLQELLTGRYDRTVHIYEP